MSATNEPVILRRLPSGDTRTGHSQGAERDRLKISLGPEEAGGFELGTLVEVASDEIFYFGQVVGRQDRVLIIQVEHSLNRFALAAINNNWTISKGT
ncbi:MAG TPA: hypothetical protein VGG72_35440 [Bryobacteraceae bacterium]